MGKCYCCVHENGHCRLMRVDDSTVCAWRRHCSSGTGEELNCSCIWMWRVSKLNWTLDISGAQVGLGLSNWALMGVKRNWAIGLGLGQRALNCQRPISFFLFCISSSALDFSSFLLFPFSSHTHIFNVCTRSVWLIDHRSLCWPVLTSFLSDSATFFLFFLGSGSSPWHPFILGYPWLLILSLH